MATLGVALPVPTGSGTGLAVATGALGRDKTIAVGGSFTGTITVEIANGGSDFCQIATFVPGDGPRILSFASEEMRTVLQGTSSSASIEVAADDIGAQAVTLDVPAGNGTGAVTDISALGTFSTVIVSGTFSGQVSVELSPDGIVFSNTFFTFTSSGCKSSPAAARFARVTRANVKAGVGGTPAVHLGAVNDAISAATPAPATNGILPLINTTIPGGTIPSGISAYAIPGHPDAIDNGDLSTPFATLQGAINAVPPPTNAADEAQRAAILCAPGLYEEDLTIPPSRRIGLISPGFVQLGTAATPRSITWTVDPAQQFGGANPALLIGSTLSAAPVVDDPNQESIGWIITGDINIVNNGVGGDKILGLQLVQVRGDVDGTGDEATAACEILIINGQFAGDFNYPRAIVTSAEGASFLGLITLQTYEFWQACNVLGGFTVSAAPSAPPPRGFNFCSFAGTFTGPAQSFILDSVTNSNYLSLGGSLGGAATRVFIGAGSSITWGNNSVGAAADTRYLTPGRSTTTASTSPIFTQSVPRAGTIINLRVLTNDSVGNGNSVVYTLHVNGAPSALTASLATGAPGQASDLVNAVDVAAGDSISMVATKALTIGNGSIDVQVTVEFI
ncbi:MAG: hypothetical protein R3322_00315 [Kiloniellales bacterium]|nr:hypothetical protein [Kiloniellales bacterium]